MARSLGGRRRFEILRRDKFTCCYCGRSAPDVPLQVDHRIPWSRGGTNAPENLITACAECNLGKSDTSLGEPISHVIDAVMRGHAYGLASGISFAWDAARYLLHRDGFLPDEAPDINSITIDEMYGTGAPF